MNEEEEEFYFEEEEYDELTQIIKDSNDFISKNKRKYHIYKQLHQYMSNLSHDTYQEALKLIQNNFNLFFANHSSAINFFRFVTNSIISNITHLELIFDILLHFREDFKNLNVTENEVFQICYHNITYINYLFHHKFISIETIVQQLDLFPSILINFFPEIQEYDQMVAQHHEFLLLRKVNEDNSLELLKKFKDLVDSDINQHIKNRELNYHPSLLHKAIREDDIDEFQSIITKNQIDINYSFEYSFYERSEQRLENPLIHVATIYNSQKICKFILLQPNFQIDQNMIIDAYSSYNFDLIHQYEKLNCTLENVVLVPIKMHQKDLLKYYLENFSDHISEKDDKVKSATNEIFDEEENIFYRLNYEQLLLAVNSLNYSIIKKCLPKIVYILKNVDIYRKNPFVFFQYSILSFSAYDLDLFKFFYYQLIPSITQYSYQFFYSTLLICLKENFNDAFKFLLNELTEIIDYETIFQMSILYNHDMANYLLDLQIKEKNENAHLNESSLFSAFMKFVSFTEFNSIFNHYDEKIAVKLFELYHSVLVNDAVTNLANVMKIQLSAKSCISLIEKVPFLQKSNNVRLNQLKKELHI